MSDINECYINLICKELVLIDKNVNWYDLLKMIDKFEKKNTKWWLVTL